MKNTVVHGTCEACRKETLVTDMKFPGMGGNGLFCKECLERVRSECLTASVAITNQEEYEKFKKDAAENDKDTEYARLVKKFSGIYPFLAKHFGEAAVIEAHARHVSLSRLTEEYPVPTENCSDYFFKDEEHYDYIGEKACPMPVFYHGRELAERERKMCHVFRRANRYQGLAHGDVILDLLYGTWPELEAFKFQAYSNYGDMESYELYPKGMDIYVPILAILSQDPERIKKRCRDYAKAYNHGDWSPNETEKRLAGENAQRLFDVIANLKPLETEGNVDE